MSPDIHWHVGEDAEQQTIAQSEPTRRSRRSRIAIAFVVLLGAGLGVAYRSLPEPPAKPTPSPTPNPVPTRPAIPAALYQTIDREARALADGDFATYRELHVPYSFDDQRSAFTAWGRPSDGRPLYEIVDFNLLPNVSAWVDIRQWRDGRYFRETRFYYQQATRWRQGLPTSRLWNGAQERLQTPHFNVTYAIEDRDVLSPTLNQMEEDYQALCHDLGCAALGHELTFTITMADAQQSSIVSGKGEIHLPSPRVMGFFESGRAYSWNNSYVHSLLVQAIGEEVNGTTSFDRPGGDILFVGLVWAINRIDPLPAEIQNDLVNFKQASLVPLQKVWDGSTGQESKQLMVQAFHLLSFVEQTYGAGAVTHLLGAASSAKSMSAAVENGLGISFVEFDQKWQTWAKQNISSP